MRFPTITALLCLLTAGCTSTRLTTDHWELRRTSFLQRVDVPKVAIAPDGTATLSGYNNDGGTEAVQAIVAAAVSAAVTALKTP